MGLTLLAHAKMPLTFWLEAFSTATILINSIRSPVLQQVSPFEKLYQKKPDYTYLKTFGCSCYSYLRYYSSQKLNYHSTKCVFIGYSDIHKGYKCFNSSGQIYISCHVISNETEYPFSILFPSTKTSKLTHSSSYTLPLSI